MKIVYVSNESGRKEVWIGAYQTTDVKIKISDSGGYNPVWRGDGRALYYLDARSRLIEVEIHPQPAFAIGAARLLFQADVTQGLTEHYVTQYAVAPDGSRFLVKAAAEADQPMIVAVRWPLHRP